MSRVALKFEIIVDVDENQATDLGGELAFFLQESWFNGEDVLEVKSKGWERIK